MNSLVQDFVINNSNAETSTTASDITPNVCAICLVEACRYTCPRCNIRYCSVSCYKAEKHVACSEEFYKQCVVDCLKEKTTGPEDRRKVLEMLQRIEDDMPVLNSDEEDVEDLQDRIADLDLDQDTDDIWERLTEGERSQFKAFLRDDRLLSLLPAWNPWWTYKTEALVEDMNTSDPNLQRVPKLKQNIPNINVLLKNKPPATTIQNDIVNVLYSYAYVTRFYNGAHWDDTVDAAHEILNLCDVLTSKTSYTAAADAIHGCIHKFNQNKEKSCDQEFLISLIKDTCSLLEGPSVHKPLLYALAALSDLRALLNSIIGSKKTITGKSRKSIFSAQKKVEFYLSWCQVNGTVLKSLIPELKLEICAMSNDLTEIQSQKTNIEQAWQQIENKKRPVIEEL